MWLFNEKILFACFVHHHETLLTKALTVPSNILIQPHIYFKNYFILSKSARKTIHISEIKL